MWRWGTLLPYQNDIHFILQASYPFYLSKCTQNVFRFNQKQNIECDTVLGLTKKYLTQCSSERAFVILGNNSNNGKVNSHCSFSVQSTKRCVKVHEE